MLMKNHIFGCTLRSALNSMCKHVGYTYEKFKLHFQLSVSCCVDVFNNVLTKLEKKRKKKNLPVCCTGSLLGPSGAMDSPFILTSDWSQI